MIPSIGDKISINSDNISGVVVDIKSDPKSGINTDWIWIEYRAKGRKKKCRIPMCNLDAYNPVITRL